MGGFMNIGNSSAKTDRSRELGGWNQEQNLFSYGLPLAKDLNTQGQQTTSAGLNSMDAVKQYFQNIMSGNRPAVMSSMAPEINMQNSAADAMRSREGTYGTSRGGGTNSLNQTAETNRMSSADQAIFGARAPAASAVAQIGGQESDIGLQQLSAGLRALGLSEDAIQNIIGTSMTSRMQSSQLNQIAQRQVGQMIGQILGLPMPGGGGSDIQSNLVNWIGQLGYKPPSTNPAESGNPSGEG